MIWLLQGTERTDPAQVLAFLPLLQPQRRSQIEGFRFARSRAESTLAELLLQYAYDAEYGGTFPAQTKTGKGKPMFADPAAPKFSLSHCAGAVACALSRDSVGVDVQHSVCWDKKFRRILSAAELAWVEASDRDDRFTALWTRKEAYGKALGAGVCYPLAETDFSGAYGVPTPVCGWQMQTVQTDGGFLSVCAKEPLPLRRVPFDAVRTFAEKKLSSGRSL